MCNRFQLKVTVVKENRQFLDREETWKLSSNNMTIMNRQLILNREREREREKEREREREREYGQTKTISSSFIFFHEVDMLWIYFFAR